MKLEALAMRFGITPDDFIRIAIDELPTRPNDALNQALKQILDKNSDLYLRLAK